jgi:RNA 3'-terminal phosphate cyclase (ATP)
VRAAAAVGEATVAGDALGSARLAFTPRAVRGGSYEFRVGTAGSTSLVLQTVLPALVLAREPSFVVVEGGTHNPAAPPFEFLARTFAPLVERMGPRLSLRLARAGFAPAGGGRIEASVGPVERLAPLRLEERGEIRAVSARALLVGLPEPIGERELRVVRRILGWPPEVTRTEFPSGARGIGNALLLEVEAEGLTEVFTGFGRRGLRAEAVAEGVAHEVHRTLQAGIAVGEHLADQLLLPLALAGSGSFTTLPLSGHATTNIEVIRRFLPVPISVEREGRGAARVVVG